MSVTKKPADWETLADVAAYLDRWAGDMAEGFRRILYGTDEPCPECYRPASGWCDDPRTLAGAPIGQYHCPGCGVMQLAGAAHMVCERCHGTGRLKTPGLVERLGVAAEHTQVPSWPERTYYLLDPTSREFSAWRSALRREIGEATP